MKKISELSRLTGIPARLFIKALEFSVEAKKEMTGAISAIDSRPCIKVAPDAVKKAREKYYEATNEYIKSSALRLWISFCTDIDDILEAYYKTEDESDDESIALTKLNEIFLRKIEEASTIEEAQALYEKTPVRSDIECLALIRINEIYQKT